MDATALNVLVVSDVPELQARLAHKLRAHSTIVVVESKDKQQIKKEKEEEDTDSVLDVKIKDKAVSFHFRTRGFDDHELDLAQSLVHRADVILADPGFIAPVIKYAAPERLKWMQSTWAGVDSLLKNPTTTGGVFEPDSKYRFTLTRLGGVFGKPMAEYVFAQILSRERRLPQLRDAQQAKDFSGRSKGYVYRELQELTLGVMGVGDIGKAIGKVGKAFGMQVLGLVRDKEQKRKVEGPVELDCCVDDLIDTCDLQSFLSRCDYVVNTLPATRDTHGLLGNEALRHMRPTGVLINVGRGDIISEKDILHALDSDWMAGAVLDVFEKEPLPETSRLWHHPKVVISPHVAALSMPQQVVELFADNLHRYLDNPSSPLLFTVDWHKGYQYL